MEIKLIQDILKYNVTRNPDKTCCVFPRDNDSSLTYSELDKKSNTFSGNLIDFGLKKGDKVLVMTTNLPESLIVYYGILKVGGVLVNVSANSSEKDVKRLLKETEAKLVIYENVFSDVIKEVKNSEMCNFIGIRTTDEKLNIDYKTVKESDKELNVDILDDDNTLILYTSGSTGLPKGSILTHKNFVSTVKSILERGLFKEGDKAYCVQPLYYIDQTIFLHTPFMLGGTVYVSPRFSKTNFWNDIKSYNIDYVSTVPVMQRILLKECIEEAKGHSLRLMFSTGQHLPLELMEEVESNFDVGLVDCYGMTEGSGFSTFNHFDKDKRKKGSIGTVLSCCEHKVIDEEGNALGVNKIGEIMVKGDNQIKGYFNDVGSSSELLDDKGWMHTGDLGYYDEEGFYYLVGRIKNLIIKGGENISTLEIEDMINSIGGVADCCAVPIPDDIYGEEIGCLVVLKKDVKCNEKEVIDYCFEKKGKLKTPKKVFFVPELPKTASGKHDLVKIKEMVLSLM